MRDGEREARQEKEKGEGQVRSLWRREKKEQRRSGREGVFD